MGIFIPCSLWPPRPLGSLLLLFLPCPLWASLQLSHFRKFPSFLPPPLYIPFSFPLYLWPHAIHHHVTYWRRSFWWQGIQIQTQMRALQYVQAGSYRKKLIQYWDHLGLLFWGEWVLFLLLSFSSGSAVDLYGWPSAPVHTDETVKTLFWASLAPATWASYIFSLSETARFLGFHDFMTIQVPFEESDIAYHIAFLFNSGLSYPTIVTCLSAIIFLFVLRNGL